MPSRSSWPRARRVRRRVLSGIKSSGLDVSDQTKVGDSSCVTSSAEQVTICLRSGSGLMVAVVVSGTDQNKAAGMVDEAWAKQ